MDLYGKAASDLQSEIAISDSNVVSGTLEYVSGYTGYSETAEEQEGNYLALQFSCDLPGATFTAALGEDAVEVSEDGIAVFRITDKATQTINVVASYPGFPDLELTLTLTGLTLEEAPAEGDG